MKGQDDGWESLSLGKQVIGVGRKYQKCSERGLRNAAAFRHVYAKSRLANCGHGEGSLMCSAYIVVAAMSYIHTASGRMMIPRGASQKM